MKKTISNKVRVSYLNKLPKKGAAKASVLDIIFKGFTRRSFYTPLLKANHN